MNNRIIVGIIFLFSAPFLIGQEAAPEEPGIVLPPTLLEVEDLQVEEISALIPDDEIQLLPELSIPLPQADDIFLPEEQFDIPYPDQLSSGQPSILPRTSARADIFSEGQIAAGSMNHVRGDLNLYRLGPDPRFDLRFYHDKIDGYGLRSAGSGFFHSDDLLEGNLAFSTAAADLSFAGGLTESSEGLQGVGDYEILTYRRVNGSGILTYPLSDTASIDAEIGTAYAQQILSSESPAITTELEIDAGAGFSFRTQAYVLDIDLEYMFLDTAVAFHRIRLDMRNALYIGSNLFIEAGVGTIWDSPTGFLLPFDILIDWRKSENFSLAANGGYRVNSPTYGEMRGEDMLLEMNGTLGIAHGWFANADFQLRPVSSLLIGGKASYHFDRNTYRSSTVYSSVSGLFPLVAESNSQSLDTSLDIDAKLNSNFSIGAGWSSRFLYNHAFLPDHVIEGSLRYRSASDIFGGDLVITAVLSNPFVLPEVALSGYYRLSESVKFSLDISDPLAPIIAGGRTYRGPYEAPGFHFFIGTNISL
ncbi:MAG: hypothetical protein HN368_06380 [Spirochaetales bacterium]|jgi:hypothetical protein|nr:hypothetical protein [Spirochaetales bacterium]